jgi:O-succinylhomoserine sulfhydrylase
MTHPADTKHATQKAAAKTYRARTNMVRGGLRRSQYGETSEAIYLTSGYCYDSAESAAARFKGLEDGFVYSRYANPTVAMFEERVALIEGVPAGFKPIARAAASGMAAVAAALLCQVKAGDHVVAARALFSSCRYIIEDLMPRYGISSTLVDGRDLAAWKAAIRPETKVFFLETPTNPTLELVDIAAVSALAKNIGARVVVDNVFATPIFQSPFKLGADVVVYSATKHMDGHGRCLGGVVLADEAFVENHLKDYLRHTGPALSPFNAWVLLKSLEDMELRVHAACASAAKIADALAEQRQIARVIYPGRSDHPQADLAKRQMGSGGALIAFEIKGGQDAAFKFMNGLDIIDISNNLGDAKSLITHPTTTTHQRLTPEARAELGIGDGLVRLSVGLEDPDDLVEDMVQALQAIG